jgi:hypothetical protein
VSSGTPCQFGIMFPPPANSTPQPRTGRAWSAKSEVKASMRYKFHSSLYFYHPSRHRHSGIWVLEEAFRPSEDLMAIPSWILGSARGLACSTFSGVAGIEAELKDRLPGSKQQDHHGEKTLHEVLPTRISTGGSFSPDSTSTFRSAPHPDRIRQAEEEFESFIQGSASSVCTLPLDRERSNTTTAGHGEDELVSSNYCRPETWHLAWEDALGVCRRSSNDDETITSEVDQEDLAARETTTGVAIARIDQVKRHLEAVPFVQQMSTIDTRPVPTEPLHRVLPQHLPHDGSTELDSLQPEPVRQEPTQESITNQLPPVDVYCPYVQCHQNLLIQRSELLSGETHHQCIHVGCSFVSVSFQEWTEHVSQPHHDAGIGFSGVYFTSWLPI